MHFLLPHSPAAACVAAWHDSHGSQSWLRCWLRPGPSCTAPKAHQGVKVDSGVNGFRPPRDFNAEDLLFGFNRQWRANHPYDKIPGGKCDHFTDWGGPTTGWRSRLLWVGTASSSCRGAVVGAARTASRESYGRCTLKLVVGEAIFWQLG